MFAWYDLLTYDVMLPYFSWSCRMRTKLRYVSARDSGGAQNLSAKTHLDLDGVASLGSHSLDTKLRRW